MRDSMVFYRSFMEAIEELDEADQLKAFWNIVKYGLNGEEPEEKGPAKAVFKMAKPQIDANEKKYQNGKKGGRPKTTVEPDENQSETTAEPQEKQSETESEPNVNVNVNDNDKKESTLKGTKEKSCRFIPPTLTDVEEYCREKEISIDCQRFVDFYESKGWMIGKNKMKDWRAAVRNWARGQRQELTTESPKRQGGTAKGNRFHNFEQRDYDYDALLRQINNGG